MAYAEYDAFRVATFQLFISNVFNGLIFLRKFFGTALAQQG
jgi:hypothetical protein